MPGGREGASPRPLVTGVSRIPAEALPLLPGVNADIPSELPELPAIAADAPALLSACSTAGGRGLVESSAVRWRVLLVAASQHCTGAAPSPLGEVVPCAVANVGTAMKRTDADRVANLVIVSSPKLVDLSHLITKRTKPTIGCKKLADQWGASRI